MPMLVRDAARVALTMADRPKIFMRAATGVGRELRFRRVGEGRPLSAEWQHAASAHEVAGLHA